MSGIVFYRTDHRAKIVEWYRENLDADIWLEQTGCTILIKDGFRFGFCDGGQTETCGTLTFVYDSKEQVDAMHKQLGEACREHPHENGQYQIYQFFAEDPDGRTVEIQTFLHKTPPV
ncbi:glyoxalase [Haloferax profundi]|uniref:Glyoxalase n=1 Tax=Haloferax profundi TaxID=1544718 RepID=A0A0W1SE11_9EURY|nr:glyoxalase [Haloferax profundi]